MVFYCVSPEKHNIVYAVAEKCEISDAFTSLCGKLARERTKMGRVVIYCRTYDEVTTIYQFFKRRLGENFTHPPSAPDLVRFRMVSMFTRCTHQSVKASVMERFTKHHPSASLSLQWHLEWAFIAPMYASRFTGAFQKVLKCISNKVAELDKTDCHLMGYSSKDLNKKCIYANYKKCFTT